MVVLDYTNGSFVPRTGWAKPKFTSDGKYNNVLTYVSFELDSDNVSSILKFNSAKNTASPDMKLYFAVDVTSRRKGTNDQMGAYDVVTNLPEAVTVLGNDDWLGTRKEESEVVALCPVSAKNYFMYTMWKDYRTGKKDDSGEWRFRFQMDGQYVRLRNSWIKTSGAYNTVLMPSKDQVVIEYGKEGGKP